MIAPRSIDLAARERIETLAAAGQLSASVVSELEGAAKSIDEAAGIRDHQSPAYLSVSAMQSRA